MAEVFADFGHSALTKLAESKFSLQPCSIIKEDHDLYSHDSSKQVILKDDLFNFLRRLNFKAHSAKVEMMLFGLADRRLHTMSTKNRSVHPSPPPQACLNVFMPKSEVKFHACTLLNGCSHSVVQHREYITIQHLIIGLLS